MGGNRRPQLCHRGWGRGWSLHPPGRQRHRKPLSRSWQSPWFRQGAEAHSSVSTSQSCPSNPEDGGWGDRWGSATGLPQRLLLPGGAGAPGPPLLALVAWESGQRCPKACCSLQPALPPLLGPAWGWRGQGSATGCIPVYRGWGSPGRMLSLRSSRFKRGSRCLPAG